jgi:hypothetical protein
MVQCTKGEILQFISKIKDHNNLIQGCKKFYEIEPRDLVYVITRKIVIENPNSEWHLLAGIEILLLTWNAVYIQRLKKDVKEKLEENILSAYTNTREDFESLKNERLETVDLNDDLTVEKIKRIFKTFSSFKSIGITGASKAIHLINPRLFMMWDNEIRKNYHCIHSQRGIQETIEECYIKFMKTMQEIAQEILQQKSLEELWKIHPTYLNQPQFVNAFSETSKREITKMLDECNYVKFRKGIDF